MSARDLFADMGIPIPSPIEIKPISRPIYRSAPDFVTWRETNLLALMRYWNALTSPSDEHLTVEDFNLFCLAQYDSDLDFRDALRADYNSKSQIP